MELVAFLAYNDDRWVFGWRGKPILLGLAIAFQIGMLLWTVWSYSIGVEFWWCVCRTALSFFALYGLFEIILDDKLSSFSKQFNSCFWSYIVLCWMGKSITTSDPAFASIRVAFISTYEAVYSLIAAIVVIGLLIKIGWLVLSLTKPRLHLRLHGYRDN